MHQLTTRKSVVRSVLLAKIHLGHCHVIGYRRSQMHPTIDPTCQTCDKARFACNGNLADGFPAFVMYPIGNLWTSRSYTAVRGPSGATSQWQAISLGKASVHLTDVCMCVCVCVPSSTTTPPAAAAALGSNKRSDDWWSKPSQRNANHGPVC